MQWFTVLGIRFCLFVLLHVFQFSDGIGQARERMTINDGWKFMKYTSRLIY